MTWPMQASLDALRIRLPIGSVGLLRLLKCAKMGLLTMLKSVMSVHAVSPLRFVTHRATLSLPLAFRRFQSTGPKMIRTVWNARSARLPLSLPRRRGTARLRRPARREHERECASAGASLLHVNPAPLRQGNLTREAEAHTRATGFGAEKRHEYLINGRRCHTATVIGNRDANLPIGKVTAVHFNARCRRLCDR